MKSLKKQYEHLAPVPGDKIHYSDVKLILGQEAFEAIRLLEYFTARKSKATPIVVRLSLGWFLSGPVPSTVAYPSTCYSATVEQDNELSREMK